MIEKQEPVFTKNIDNSEMLKRSLESEGMDADIIPVIEKFFSLPITPRESCYGHIEELKDPYFSYIEDDVQNEREKNFQKLFKERIAELTAAINKRIGSEAVSLVLEEMDHGGGPKNYTLRFEIIDEKVFQENSKEFLGIIWEEFSIYLDELK